MRLWTLHPQYLDSRGLVALWREGLLAQRVCLGKTRGYRHHPQLERFRSQPDPVAALGAYLAEIYRESRRRGYRFSRARICKFGKVPRIPETLGQLLFEWKHLLRKLKIRSPQVYAVRRGLEKPLPHPLFRIVGGGARSWEKRSVGGNGVVIIRGEE